MRISIVMRSTLIIVLFAIVSVEIIFNENKPNRNQFSSDACGYYIYLPAIFIYHDLNKLAFYNAIDSEYQFSSGVQYSFHKIEKNGKILNKYPIGVSFFELPFFLIANLYSSITNQYKADGFTMPYQLAMILSNIFWVVTGLFILRQFLRRHFADKVAAITLLCIAFGTNLYAYSSFSVGMSHPYSFFLFSGLLLLTDIWFAQLPCKRTSILLGLVLGFIFIVRPINGIVMIIPLFWMVSSFTLIKERLLFFSKHYKYVLLSIVSMLLIACVQFSYWKYITGRWIFYSYQGEGFDFLNPHILKGLFSYRKGWFVYTPMALIGFTGFYFLWKKEKRFVPVLAAYFLLIIYAVFSWREWWFGGSFGCRPLIESLAILSLPLAALIERVYNSTGGIRIISFSALLLIVVLNIFQTYQYSMGLIHWDRMTREYYWKVFGRLEFDRTQNDKYLIKPENESKDDN